MLRRLALPVSFSIPALVAVLLFLGAAAGSAQAPPALKVEMTGFQEGDTVRYSIVLVNTSASRVGDIFIAATVPQGATFGRATATPSGSWFRGLEGAGAEPAAVWLSEGVPPNGRQGPFGYTATAPGAVGQAKAWVRWTSPTEGVAMSPGVRPMATAAMIPVAAFGGSETCKTCHAALYDSWRNTLHANMIRPLARGDLSNSRADLTVDNAPRPDQYDWAFVIGGWYKEERYAYRDASGVLRTGEYEYNVPRKTFTLRKDSTGNLEALDWINECGACHATGMDPQNRQWKEFNIACEACHGPGQDHARSPASVKMYVDSSSENCGKCHIRGRDKSGQVNYPVGYEYGKPSTLMANFNPIPMTDAASVFPDQKNSNRHRQQYLDFSKSGHAAWDVGCTTCHDPHKGSLTERKVDLRAPADQLCAKCHSQQVSASVAHSGHTLQSASCASCHLPKLIGSGSVSTHTFEAIAPAKTLQLGPSMANSCTYRCHTAQGVEWADQQFKRLFKK